MVVQYFIPNQTIEKFMERGKPKLAYLVGYKNGEDITVSHLVIPNQQEFRQDSNYGKFELWNIL